MFFFHQTFSEKKFYLVKEFFFFPILSTINCLLEKSSQINVNINFLELISSVNDKSKRLKRSINIVTY